MRFFLEFYAFFVAHHTRARECERAVFRVGVTLVPVFDVSLVLSVTQCLGVFTLTVQCQWRNDNGRVRETPFIPCRELSMRCITRMFSIFDIFLNLNYKWDYRWRMWSRYTKNHSRFLHSRKIYFRPRRGDVFLAGCGYLGLSMFILIFIARFLGHTPG